MRRASIVLSLLLTGFLVAPAASPAGTYADWECAGPTGSPTAARGFDAVQSPEATAVNGCGSTGGSLSVGLSAPGPWAGGLSAAYRYAAPDDTRIVGVTIDRSTTGAPVGRDWRTYQINADNTLIDGCLPQTACAGDVSGTVVRSGLSAEQLVLSAGCGGLAASNTCGFPVRLAVGRAGIGLQDDIAPTASNIKGSLFAAAPKSGTATVEFDGADRGGGVYRMVTTIDNRRSRSSPPRWARAPTSIRATATPTSSRPRSRARSRRRA